MTIVADVGGKKIKVVRSKTKSRTGLSLEVDGVDKTMQTAKDTQALVTGMFGDGRALVRRAFRGQHPASDMLAQSDGDLLAALEGMVGLERFQGARAEAAAEVRRAKDERLSVEGGLAVRLKVRSEREGLCLPHILTLSLPRRRTWGEVRGYSLPHPPP